MKVLGIDPGYERCGYAVLQQAANTKNKVPKVVDLGVIKTSPKDIFPDRLKEIGDDIEHLLKRENPDLVAIEDLFFVQNVTTGLKVAEVRGVITYLAQSRGCTIIDPKPVEIKSFFTGNGRADKKAMLEMAQSQFDLPKGKLIDDAIDALAIAYFGLHSRPRL